MTFRKTLTVIFAVLAALLFSFSPAYGETSSEFIVDKTGLLDEQTLKKTVNSMDKPSEVKYAFVLSNDKSLTEDDYDNDVRSYAATVLPKEIMVDEDSLDNNVVLIAISPTIRKLGVYAGSEIDINESNTNEIVNSMTEAAKNGDWTQAFIDGSKKSNDLLNPTVQPKSEPKQEKDETVVIPYWSLGALGTGILGWITYGIVSAVRRKKRDIKEFEAFPLAPLAEVKEMAEQAKETDSILRKQGIKSSLEVEYLDAGFSSKRIRDYLANPIEFETRKFAKGTFTLSHLKAINNAVKDTSDQIERSLIDAKLLPAWENKWARMYSDALTQLESARNVNDLDPDEEIDIWLKNVNKKEKALQQVEQKVKEQSRFTLSFAQGEIKTILATLKKDGKTFAKRYYANNPYFLPTKQGSQMDSLMPLMLISAVVASSNNSSSTSSNSYYDSNTMSTSTSFSSFSGGDFSGGSGSF